MGVPTLPKDGLRLGVLGWRVAPVGKVYSRLAISGNERCEGPAASMGEHGGVAGPGAARVGIGAALRFGRRRAVGGEEGGEPET